jgi:hypothetical protein
MWKSHIHVNVKQLALGSFDTKEEAAAAFDGAARRHFKEEAKCNFDMEKEDAVSADKASREAIQTRQLIHEGRIALIKKRAIYFGLGKGYSEEEALVYGDRNQLGAYKYIVYPYAMHCALPIWERIFEREKDLVAYRRNEAAERPATIADRACWDAVWAAANRPRGLLTPSSHMVCRARSYDRDLVGITWARLKSCWTTP